MSGLVFDKSIILTLFVWFDIGFLQSVSTCQLSRISSSVLIALSGVYHLNFTSGTSGGGEKNIIFELFEEKIMTIKGKIRGKVGDFSLYF